MINSLIALDRAAFLAINSIHVQWLNPIMTLLSGQLIWVPFVTFFIILAYKKSSKKEFSLYILFLVLTIIACDVTSSHILKNIVTRLRPCREIDLKPFIYSFGQKCGGRFGFVSSHAANSLAVILFSLRSLKLHGKSWYFLFLMPLLVGYSRVYLGVHYPGDIVGGMIVGAVWSLFFSWIYNSRHGANR